MTRMLPADQGEDGTSLDVWCDYCGYGFVCLIGVVWVTNLLFAAGRRLNKIILWITKLICIDNDGSKFI